MCFGEEVAETMLIVMIKVGRQLGLLVAVSVDRVIVDTTVMALEGAYPTGSRLLEKARELLLNLAEGNGLMLRQSYNREAARMAMQAARYPPCQSIAAHEEVAAHGQIPGRVRTPRH
jgi:hypothetical protein